MKNILIFFLIITIKTQAQVIPIAFIKSSTISIPFTLPTVTIGGKEWMANNLDVTTYRDGTEIPYVSGTSDWANLTTGAWCWPGGVEANGAIYGKLYNWYAVNDPKGFCPVGSHMPTDAEWSALATAIGSSTGGKMKTTGTSRWQSTNVGATNSSNFGGLPGGSRNNTGSFTALLVGQWAFFWSATSVDGTTAKYRNLDYFSASLTSGTTYKKNGMSVRCIKD